ncbi:MAG TPA: SpoIIE family protein phosphatase [Herpetosiphonaceae bacterium]
MLRLFPRLFPRNWRLRTRLLMALLSVAVIPLGLSASFSIGQSSTTLLRRISRELQQQADTRAATISSQLGEQIRLLQLLSNNITIFSAVHEANKLYPLDPAASAAIRRQRTREWATAPDTSEIVFELTKGKAAIELYQFRQLVDSHAEIVVTDLYGAVVATSNRAVNYDHTGKEWWEMLRSGRQQIYLGHPSADEAPGLPGLVIALPIVNPLTQQPVGIVRSIYNLSALQPLLTPTPGLDPPNIMLVDQDATILASTQASEIGQIAPPALLDPITNPLDERNIDQAFIRAISRVQSTAAHPAIGSLDWRVVVAQNQEVALAPVINQVAALVFGGLIVAFVAAVLALIIGRRLTRPLDQMAEAARNDDLNMLAAAPFVDTRDEVGQMARSIHGLARRLLASRQELEATNRDLEATVIERTSSLRSALAAAEQASAQFQSLSLDLSAKNEALERDLRLAHDIQLSLLPHQPPWDQALLAVASVSLPASEVGGDLYAYIDFADYRMGVAIGDISGKGVSAALMMALVSSAIETQARQQRQPHQTLAALNQQLTSRLQANHMNAGLLYAQIDLRRRQLSLANAGMIAPLLLRDGEARTLEAYGLPIGAIASPEYRTVQLDLQPGDLLVLASDGVIEAQDNQRGMFGFERFEALVSELGHLPPEQMVSAILERLAGFTDGAHQHDDITLVILRPNFAAMPSDPAQSQQRPANAVDPFEIFYS